MLSGLDDVFQDKAFMDWLATQGERHDLDFGHAIDIW
jgi:hypothetical protein